MKKISLLISALVLFAACAKESPIDGNQGVQIRLSTGYSLSGMTRAELSDVSIREVDVLVFDNSATTDNHLDAKFLYSRYAWQKSGDLYSATLKEGSNLDIYFVINARSTLSAAALVANMTWEEAQKKLVMQGAVDRPAKGLPMWGYSYGQSVNSNASKNDFGTVKVVRAIAAADVEINATNFILQETSAEYVTNQGYLAFLVDAANLKGKNNAGEYIDLVGINNPQVDYYLQNPLIPAGTTTGISPNDNRIVHTLDKDENSEGYDGNSSLDKLYFYENEGPNSETAPTNGRKYTKIVLKGKWDKGTPLNPDDDVVSYYPLAFRDTRTEGNDNARVPIVRNRKFTFSISKVNGDGYPTLEEAKQGSDLNISYDVIEWDEWTDTNLIVGGDGRFISLSPSRNEGLIKAASLYRNATSTDQIDFTTDITIDEFSLALTQSGAQITLTEAEKAAGYAAKIANEFYEIALIKLSEPGSDGEYRCRFIFTARKDYLPAEPTPASTMTVSAGMVRFAIEVFQRNASPEDWEDGGNQHWDAE